MGRPPGLPRAEGGPRFEEAVAFYRHRGTANPIRAIVVVTVERALPLTSPAYDLGLSEAEVRERWKRHWDAVGRRVEERLSPG